MWNVAGAQFTNRKSQGSVRGRRGFTLVELLVVIAIIGILVALLLPAVQSAREAARRSSCQNNIKQVGLALINYESANKGFPPSWIYDEETYRPHLDNEFAANWVVATLPFMEGQALYDAIDFTVPISAAVNEPVRSTRLQSMLCPSDDRNEVPFNGRGTEGVNWARGNYGANAGNGPQITRWSGGITGPESTGWRAALRRGMIAPNVSLPVGRITDGTSNTLMLAELRAGLHDGDRRGVWALGQAGGSVLFWFGACGDANGPNACYPNADDIEGCRASDLALMEQECMQCYTGDDWTDQAAPRSQHTGGVYVCMADGSVQFASDDIEVSGSYGNWGSIWDRMISSADGQVMVEAEGNFIPCGQINTYAY